MTTEPQYFGRTGTWHGLSVFPQILGILPRQSRPVGRGSWGLDGDLGCVCVENVAAS